MGKSAGNRSSARRCRLLSVTSIAVLATGALSCGEDATEPRRALFVSPPTARIAVGSQVQLRAKLGDATGDTMDVVTAVWSSGDESIASVDVDGVVTGQSSGFVWVKTAYEELEDSTPITVLPRISTLEISPAELGIVVGGPARLTATPRDADGSVPDRRVYTAWSSSDTMVVRVDSAGTVMGVAEGSATITATVEGRSATAEITVSVISFVSLSAGWYNHRCGLTQSGSIYCWGRNADGELGNGSLEAMLSPTRVASDLTFLDVDAGVYFTCAIAVGGAAYCWGWNRYGQQGNGTFETSAVPVPVVGGHEFVEISAGRNHACGITTGGETYCWGSNRNGELGMEGGEPCSYGICGSTPVRIPGDLEYDALRSGGHYTCGLLQGSDAAWCWGYNGYGQLGLGTDQPNDTIQAVPVSVPSRFKSLSANYYSPCGVALSDERIYCWGENDFGMLGRGFRSDEEHDLSPIAIDMSFSSVDTGMYFACGLGVDGGLYCWGRTSELSLTESPTRLDTELVFSSISLNYNVCGIATDGFAYCVGRSYLGDGTDLTSSTFVRVVGQE